MIKLITFDIGGTIVKSAGKESKLCKIEKIIKYPKEIFKEDYKKIFCTSNISIDEMINIFSKKYHIDNIKEFKEIFKKDSLAMPQNIFEEIIYDLNELGYKIATISNACCWTYTSLENTSLGKYIDKEFYSFNIGYTKPNIKVFKHVEEYYKLNPNEILHIGDSYISDYVGAKKSGWNSYLYKDNESIKAFINNLKGGK